jgi:hypothetical protein
MKIKIIIISITLVFLSGLFIFLSLNERMEDGKYPDKEKSVSQAEQVKKAEEAEGKNEVAEVKEEEGGEIKYHSDEIDCSSEIENNIRDICYKNLAVRDVSLDNCNNIIDAKIKTDCFDYVLVKQSERDNDLEKCIEIKDSYLRNVCNIKHYRKNNFSKDSCLLLPGDVRKYCDRYFSSSNQAN